MKSSKKAPTPEREGSVLQPSRMSKVVQQKEHKSLMANYVMRMVPWGSQRERRYTCEVNPQAMISRKG